MNIIDRIISYISPASALSRIRSRSTLQMLEASYKAGSSTSHDMKTFKAYSKSADADTIPYLEIMRARSRDLVRNSAIARGVIESVTTGVLGEGLKLMPSLNEKILGISYDEAQELSRLIRYEFDLWADSIFCDTERQLNFYGLQELVLKSFLESGDVFVNLTSRDFKVPYSSALNVIEADLCKTPLGLKSNPGVIGGVRKDSSGAPVSYFFVDRRLYSEVEAVSSLSNISLLNKYIEVSRYNKSSKRQILHIYKKERSGQTRGVPFIAPVMHYMKNIERYSEAELQAAVIASYFTVAISDNVSEPATAPKGIIDSRDGGIGEMELGSGTIAYLGENKKIDIVSPERPSTQYEAFILSNIKLIGMGLNIPFEVLFKHFDSSYSASQGALLEAYKFYKRIREFFIREFCNPVYEYFLDEAVRIGRIVAPGYFEDPLKRKAYLKAIWLGPSKEMIDENRAVNAAVNRINAGLSSKSVEAMKLSGLDWEDIAAQRKREIEKEKEIGVVSE